MKTPKEGDRKFVVALIGMAGMGLLCLGAFILVLAGKVVTDYIKAIETFAGVVTMAVGSFMLGNAAEHWTKTRHKPPPEGDP